MDIMPKSTKLSKIREAKTSALHLINVCISKEFIYVSNVKDSTYRKILVYFVEIQSIKVTLVQILYIS